MTHVEAVHLLRPVQIQAGETWADLGAGTGTFSRALAELVGSSRTIHAVDRDKHALTQLSKNNPLVVTHHQDFTDALNLNHLDGILVANALHFVRQQEKVLKQLVNYLKPSGKLVIIEYDISRANPWVPFPVSFEKLQTLVARANLSEPVKVATKDSRYHREMYVAVVTLKSSV
jgi:ubiquinone/menaquinone biosynthesis C-methylase UbiE